MNPSTETFYSTFAQLAFALLGLWWVVVQFRHEEWMRDRRRRGNAFYVSLYFALPGLMSLLSLLSADATLIWRTAFGVAGLFGVIVGARLALAASSTWETVATWLGVVLFGVVTLVAAVPSLVASMGLSLTPIQVEGITLSVILLVGVAHAWRMFADPSPVQGDSE
jgi:hypothetical protein